MSIFTGILLIICTLFTIYKVIKTIKFFTMQKKKKFPTTIIEKTFFDSRFHSSPSFDFPNTQSEADMKIINSGPNLCEKQNAIEVKEYCKY
ncbi:MAG: hypothetical protein NC124_06870 [Clostridium sp.]|nr:hypothetical protein [Clostridium sp.]